MLILPAIDLRAGKCVRLIEGRLDQETVFSDYPAAMAGKWLEQGAEFLHVVDLDGAFKGSPQNLAAIRDIIANVTIPVEVGGGIRSLQTIDKLLNIGIERVIVGTAVVSEPAMVREACREFGERLVIGLDAKDGKIALQGWEQLTDQDVLEVARRLEDMGARRIIYTDISRDGTLKGVSVDSTARLAQAVSIPVIASGGVAGIDDITALKKVEDQGIEGVIVGKAIYSGTLDLRAAIAVAKGEQSC